MSRTLDKATRRAVKRAMSLRKHPPLKTESKPIKKAPVKRELLEQTTACGGVAVGAPCIPPANKNKKSKL